MRVNIYDIPKKYYFLDCKKITLTSDYLAFDDMLEFCFKDYDDLLIENDSFKVKEMIEEMPGNIVIERITEKLSKANDVEVIVMLVDKVVGGKWKILNINFNRLGVKNA